MEHESNTNLSCNWYAWNDPQRLGKKSERFGNRKTNQDHSNYRIVKINQNTE